MAPGVLTSAYNEADGNYILDNEHVRGLIALCDACPLEFSFENETDLENLRFSEVLQWKELGGVDDIDVLEKTVKTQLHISMGVTAETISQSSPAHRGIAI